MTAIEEIWDEYNVKNTDEIKFTTNENVYVD
jgi:hypothetical protein